MKCPCCNVEDQSTVLSSRSREWGMKRIRHCLSCNRNFATIEIYKITDDALNSLSKSKKRIKTNERKRNEKV